MNISEVTDRLKTAGITSNPEVVRRWIRQGKLAATMHSRKQGYQVLPTDLEGFISSYDRSNRKSIDKRADTEYFRGFQDGYAKAQADQDQLFQRLLRRGSYTDQYRILRADVKQLVMQGGPLDENKQALMEYIDRDSFGRDDAGLPLKRPKSFVAVIVLGKHMRPWTSEHIMPYSRDNGDGTTISPEVAIRRLLVSYYRQAFADQQKAIL